MAHGADGGDEARLWRAWRGSGPGSGKGWLTIGSVIADREAVMGAGGKRGGAATPQLFCVDMTEVCQEMKERWLEDPLEWAAGCRGAAVMVWAHNFTW